MDSRPERKQEKNFLLCNSNKKLLFDLKTSHAKNKLYWIKFKIPVSQLKFSVFAKTEPKSDA